jgi:hypothetical protein
MSQRGQGLQPKEKEKRTTDDTDEEGRPACRLPGLPSGPRKIGASGAEIELLEYEGHG